MTNGKMCFTLHKPDIKTAHKTNASRTESLQRFMLGKDRDKDRETLTHRERERDRDRDRGTKTDTDGGWGTEIVDSVSADISSALK